MPLNEEPVNPTLFSRRRRVNPDGTVNVACKVCGRIIASNSRESIRTATCYACSTGSMKPQPQQVPIVGGVPRPDLMQESQDELLDAIWRQERGVEVGSVESKTRRRWTPFDLVAGAFKALGFSQQKKAEQPVGVVYDNPDGEGSKQIAKRKVREPIFGKKG